MADPSASSPAAFSAALAAAAAAAGWAPLARVDAALLVFVLSAVPPGARLHALLASVVRALRPGGALLVRDHGLYDLPMLRFPPAAQRGSCGRVFARGDGTLARFFDKDALADEVEAAAAAAGAPLRRDAAEWCCVVVRNRAAGVEMRRVFVHAAWTRLPEEETAAGITAASRTAYAA